MGIFFLVFVIVLMVVSIYSRNNENVFDPIYREDGKFELRVKNSQYFEFLFQLLFLMIVPYSGSETEKIGIDLDSFGNFEELLLLIACLVLISLLVGTGLEIINKRIVYGEGYIEKVNTLNRKSKVDLNLISGLRKSKGSLRIIGRNGENIKVKSTLKGYGHFVRFLRSIDLEIE